MGAGPRRSVATGLHVAEATFGPFLDPAARAWVHGVRGTQILRRRSLGALRAPLDRPKTVTPRDVAGEIAPRLAVRADAAFRLEELRLHAARRRARPGRGEPRRRRARRRAAALGAPDRPPARAPRSAHPLARASWADRALVVEAAICLAAARAAVVLLPFRVLARGLGVHMAESPVAGAPPTEACAHQLGDRRHLRALAVAVEVPGAGARREGDAPPQGRPEHAVPGRGAGRDGVEAHAWLRTGTVHVTGGRDTSRYGVVSTFADAP